MYPNCTPRKPRGWRDPTLFPTLCFEDSGKLFEALEDIPLGTIKVVGADSQWERIEVTLNDGTIVPAIRRIWPDGSSGAVCQNFDFKAVRAS